MMGDGLDTGRAFQLQDESPMKVDETAADIQDMICSDDHWSNWPLIMLHQRS